MTLDATVVIRTIGRETLNACLASLAACEPRAAEVLIVDQGAPGVVAGIAARHEGVRVVASPMRGRARAANDGFRAAAHDTVLFTDDDCTVEPDWVAVAVAAVGANRELCVTGRIEPVGDWSRVPVRRQDPEPHDWTGRPRRSALIACNFACSRAAALALGGFDADLPTMEDWDFGYRWVRSGRPMTYEPQLVVHHHDWRTPPEMRMLWEEYGEGVGAFYAKLAARRDPNALAFLAGDVGRALQALVRPKGVRKPWMDARVVTLSRIPRGWRARRSAARSPDRAAPAPPR